MDYPAAHSMDTHWFAVDDCGHVAACDSGEEGSVPEEAVRDDFQLDDRSRRRDASPAPVFAAMDERHLERLTAAAAGRHATQEPAVVLMVEPTADPEVLSLAARARALLSRPLTSGRMLLVLPKGAPAVSGRLHQAGLCAWCIGRSTTFAHGSARLDLFWYEHAIWDRSTPYLRLHAPAAPARLEGLPIDAALKEKIAAVRLDGCFAERFVWQPAETHRCRFWTRPHRIMRAGSEEFERILRTENWLG